MSGQTVTSFSKPSVIINSAAGSTEDISDDIVKMFELKGYTKPIVHLVSPTKLDKAFSTVATDGTDLLIVYGGDGTCKSGAVIAKKNDIPFIALPGGTMNMLPKALYGTDDWKEALTIALSQSEPRWHPAGLMNGHIFLCGAIIGDPIVMSDARESLRDGQVMDAVKQIPDIMNAISHGHNFEFKVDGVVFDKDANALLLNCPHHEMTECSNPRFEIMSAPQLSIRDMISIGAKALIDDLRQSAFIKATQAHQVNIEGQGAFDVLLDGEHETVTCPVNVKLEPYGVRVLAPKELQGDVT